MSPEDFETCFVPVPIRWRHVVAGDVIVGKGGLSWIVAGRPLGGGVELRAIGKWTGTVDPDDVVQVLTPVPMAQAVALTREQIGMQLIERRNTREEAA
jgi:hypothetical protein